MQMNTRVFADLDALSAAALAELLQVMDDSIRQRGRFAIALAGGRTPARLYALWVAEGSSDGRTPWERVHLFWGDERFVPHDDLLSNYRMARESLIAHVPIPAANLHPIPTGLARPEDCARTYEAELRKFFGEAPPAFDLQLLGLGDEGHTASLFPSSHLLEETERWVGAAETPAQPSWRLTLTPAVLNQGRNTFFLVSGAGKREIIAALRSVSPSDVSRYPAGRIHPEGGVLWFLDRAAAG